MPENTDVRLIAGHAFARVGPRALTVCAADPLTDAMASEFIRATAAMTPRDHATVALSHYAHAVPNAKQRQIMLDAMAQHRVPAIQRQVLLTDSQLMRGAMTAFGWITGADSASYALRDRQQALSWLAERASFDLHEASYALERCFALLQLPLPRPGR